MINDELEEFGGGEFLFEEGCGFGETFLGDVDADDASAVVAGELENAGTANGAASAGYEGDAGGKGRLVRT